MSFLRQIPANEIWLRQLFSAKAVETGGVIRRSVKDVERKIGRDVLELEVRRRHFHLVEAGGQFIIICAKGGLRVIV